MGQIDVVNEEDRVIFLGDGVKVYEEKIRESLGIAAKIAPAHLRLQNAASIAVLGAKLYEEGKTVTGAEFEPVYLRLSQAERERLDKEKTEKEGSFLSILKLLIFLLAVTDIIGSCLPNT